MSLWFRRTQGLDSEAMRQIADNAGVSWSVESVVYRSHGIGFADGDSADVEDIKDAAENLLGYRPVEIEEPAEPAQE